MKHCSNPKIYIRILVLSALVSMLWSNSVTYYSWSIEMGDLISHNFYDLMDGESEKESEETEKDKDHEIQSNINSIISFAHTAPSRLKHLEAIQTLHHPEILTPPPKSLSILL